MTTPPFRILFMIPVDADVTNAQSLNAREIALRLDPNFFSSTLFYEQEPDPRLFKRPNVRLLKLPTRLQTIAILKELYRGYSLISYMDCSPAAYLFLHSPKIMRRDTRTVLHVEGPSGQLNSATRWLRFLHKSITPRCDVHVAITECVAENMRSYGLRPEWILPVGVDTSRFTPPAVRSHEVPTVLFAGAVIERKGAHLVVDVARQVPEARFLIVGAPRGGFDRVVSGRIAEHGVTNIEMLGPQSQERMIETMQASHIFLLPSHLEGIPKVTLEAAATGLPCVVFNSYETPSVIDGVTGFQVANLNEMVERVKLLIRDTALRQRMGMEAVQHARRFDWDAVAAKWQEAYLRFARGAPEANEVRSAAELPTPPYGK